MRYLFQTSAVADSRSEARMALSFNSISHRSNMTKHINEMIASVITIAYQMLKAGKIA